MTDPNKIIWWHFSDVHWKVGASSERSRFLNRLWLHLQSKLVAHGIPDFIVISGDIAYSGAADEYTDARTGFIDPLMSLFSDPPLVFLVPGNHDVSRDVSKWVNSKAIDSISSKAQLEDFLDDPTAVGMVEIPFKAFLEFSKEIMPDVEWGTLGWSYSLTIKGKRVRIVGANSAWASSYNKDEEGRVSDERKLLVGQSQVSDLGDAAGERELSLYVQHHPLRFLNSIFEHTLRHFVQRRFDFFLSGHAHTVHDLATTIGPTGQCTFLPSPAIHDRPNTGSLEYVNGYDIVVLDLASKKGAAYYFRYSDVYGDKFTDFIELYAEGKTCYEIQLRSSEPEALTEAEPQLGSFEEILDRFPKLKPLAATFSEHLGEATYRSHSVDLYDHLCLTLVGATSMIDKNDLASGWEAFLFARFLLIEHLLHLDASRGERRGYDWHGIPRSFDAFVDLLGNKQGLVLSVNQSTYKKLARLSLDDTLLARARSDGLPSHIFVSSHRFGFWANWCCILTFLRQSQWLCPLIQGWLSSLWIPSGCRT